MTGFEYGNTRLRAWRSRLLRPADYAGLIAVASIDQLLGALADTPYALDIEVATARSQGLRSLDEAVRRNLARTMRTMLSFYDGRPAAMVELLLDRWDLQNLRALLRLPDGPTRPDTLESLLVAAGRLDEPALHELASLPDAAARIDLLIAWELPSPPAAHRLLRLRRGDTSGEVAAAGERVLEEAFAARLDEVLGDERGGPAAVLRAGVDAGNLMTALRLRAAHLAGEPTPDPGDVVYLPAGVIDPAVWPEIAAGGDAEEVVANITRHRTLPGWEEPLRRWQEHQDLALLADELRRATSRAAVARFVQGDPLGFDVPVAFVFAKEIEARNLRLIARGIVHGLPTSEVADLLEVAA